MILVPNKKVWTKQPPIGTGVDYPGLAFVMGLTNSMHHYCPINKKWTVAGYGGGNAIPSAGPGGHSQDFGTGYAVPAVLDMANGSLPSFGTDDFAVLVVASCVAGAANYNELSNKLFSGTNVNWRLKPNDNVGTYTAGAYSFLTSDSTNGNLYVGAANVFSSYEVRTCLGVRRGTTVELWVNGYLVASNTGTIRDVSEAEAEKIGFGFGYINSYVQRGHRYLGCGFRKTVNQAEAKSLSSNPWQIFRPRTSAFYYSAGAPEASNTPVPWFY